MGNCVKSRVVQPESRSTASMQAPQVSSQSREQHKLSGSEQEGNRKHNVKHKAPVADNRVRILENADAPTAEVTQQEMTARDRAEVKRALQSHFLFNSLSEANLESVINEMLHFALGPKEIVFSQGQPGKNFFVVASGRVEIIVNGKTKGYVNKGQSFGELALMHDSGRTATIRTAEATALWGIDRERFRSAVQSINERKYAETKQFLDCVPLFNSLTDDQKESLLTLLVSQEFTDNQKIVVEGDPGDLFYIIKDGEVRCSKQGTEIRRMGKGEFFGEQALLHNTQRTATVTAIGTTAVLSLGRESLVTVLGDQLQEIIYHNSQTIALEASSVFRHLTKNQSTAVIRGMRVVSYEAGSSVIPATALKGERLWIVLKGLVQGDKEYKPNQCIGDLYLNDNPEVEFEVEFTAATNCDIAEAARSEIEASIGGSLSEIFTLNEVVGILRKVQLLRTLPTQTIERLALTLKLQEFQEHATIFTQGEPGNAFYIVKHGKVDIVRDNTVLRAVGKHDYFGERAILLDEVRTATVICRSRTTVWVLSKQAFLDLVDEHLRLLLLKRMELQNDQVELSDLRFVKVLGKGMFGNVVLTTHTSKQTLYALKSVDREKVLAYEIYENIVLERQILLQLDHPLILKLVKTFKDQKRLYFLMEFVRGIDLFDVLRILNLLNNDSSRFYAACLLLILEHLHERQIIYRDLKPENVMVDEDGYPKLIDFGTAKLLQGRTYTVVGTPHYMAPEVIVSKGYNVSADYWSLGIMLYEFICGGVPFGEDEEDPYKIYEKVLESRLNYPRYVSSNFRARPFIEKLLSKNPAMRGTYQTIKEHTWFTGIDWEKLLSKQITSPHCPNIGSLAAEVSAALRKPTELIDMIEREEKKDVVVPSRRKVRPPPNGWDDEF